MSGEGRARPWRWVAGSVGALLAIATLIGFNQGYLPIRRFDAASWRQAEGVYSGIRLQMVEHLMGSGKLDGLTRAEATSLLGKPGETPYFADWDLVYWLGDERGWMSIDSEWLVVRFGKDGRVSDYRVVRD